MTNTGGPAFPAKVLYYTPDSEGFSGEMNVSGMTLLDYFAGKAMQSIVLLESKRPLPAFLEAHAKLAYEIAEKMLAEKERREKG